MHSKSAAALAPIALLAPLSASAQQFSYAEVVNTFHNFVVLTPGRSPSGAMGFHFTFLDSVPSLSADGRFLAFRAVFDTVDGQPDSCRAVFVADVPFQKIRLIARTRDT